MIPVNKPNNQKWYALAWLRLLFLLRADDRHFKVGPVLERYKS